MIQIDIPMPESCYQCPMFKDAVFGACNLTDEWFKIEDREWVKTQRSQWCPLKEVGGEQDEK